MTLRGRVLGLALSVAFAPAFVALAGLGVEGLYAQVLDARVREAGAALAGGADPEAVAAEQGVRVRIFAGADGVVGVGDEDGDTRRAVGARIFGEATFPSFADWDRAAPDAVGEVPDGCVVALDRRVRVCTATATLPSGRTARADAIARRHALFLADDLFAVLEIVAVGAAVGLAFATALGRRLVRDVEGLAARAA
ncbi:MAG: hypothetical protein Q8P41_19345, partial [Pseudomonadota bacterium]|nr:hypothetical protein [Pseudomonadota bacterium]